VTGIAAKVAPALVDVNATFNYQNAAGAGTGVVLTSDGEVITNNHVVNGATSIRVTDVGNGQTYRATVVGYDASHDIAVLQLQGASGLRTASIGDSSTATVGEPIVAVGNAGGSGGAPTSAGGAITGLDQSVTAGDDLNGTTEQLAGMIGVNADVQAGDSGGSLVNSAGQVIGIDTAGSSRSTSVDFSSQSSAVQAYAVPINTAMSIAQQIESGQGTSTIHVGTTAFLGVMTSSSGTQGAGGSGGSEGSGTPTGASGVAIAGVVSGGAAAQAGLAEGDVITSLDGQTVSAPSDLTKLLVPLHPEDKVEVGWVDSSGQSHTGSVVLGSGPPA
jgi:S1-C subfamily serine protease